MKLLRNLIFAVRELLELESAATENLQLASDATMQRNTAFIGLALTACCTLAGATCVPEASLRYSVPEPLIRGIIQVESAGKAHAMNLGHKARTGSYDIGLMQINSSWLKTLKKYNIDEQALKDPCTNVMVGTWILANHMKENGYDWNGVGSYNASCKTLSKDGCFKARSDYTWKVYRAMLKQADGNDLTAVAYKKNKSKPAGTEQSQETRMAASTGSRIRSVTNYEDIGGE